jgi:membrane-bound lytic murein transglycosylase B
MLRVGRGGRRAHAARVRDLSYLADEPSGEAFSSHSDQLSDPLASPWQRPRRRAWRWWLAAALPVLTFLAGWLVAKPDAQAVHPQQAVAAAAGATTATATAPAPSTGQRAVSLEEAQRLGKEAAERWLEDWAAIARLAGTDIGQAGAAAAAGGAPPPQAKPSGLGIPGMMLQAYEAAAQWARGYAPGCRLHWAFVAGVGRVESNHGRHGGAGFTASGQVRPPIVGIPLDGRPGVKRIADTDDGRWDGDSTWDRAVGPMQFLPTSWRALGRDGNGDGVADPHNAFDAAVSAAAYLCRSGGGSLSDRATLERALYGYNHSATYVRTVLTWADAYGISGATALPNPAPR